MQRGDDRGGYVSSADAKWLRMEYELGVVGCEMVATGIRDRSRREVMLVFLAVLALLSGARKSMK